MTSISPGQRFEDFHSLLIQAWSYSQVIPVTWAYIFTYDQHANFIVFK